MLHDSSQLVKRSKVATLPDDLRGIAEAMLREKFDPPKDSFSEITELYYTEMKRAWGGVDIVMSEAVKKGDLIVMKPHSYGKSQFMKWATGDTISWKGTYGITS